MKILTPEEIHSITNKVFQMEINVKSRKGYAPQGRACFYWYCRKYTLLTFDEIAKMMGGRDHATAYFATKALENTYMRSESFKSRFERIGNILEKRAEKIEVVVLDETPENKEIRNLKKLLVEKEKEIIKLRQRTDQKLNNEIKRMLSMIPDGKVEDFKETRLRPYLRMNGVNQSH